MPNLEFKSAFAHRSRLSSCFVIQLEQYRKQTSSENLQLELSRIKTKAITQIFKKLMPVSLFAFSQIPILVQVQQKWRRMYAGECQGPGVRTDFEMVHLRKVPTQYNHLSGLLDIFKSKIVSIVHAKKLK